MSWQLELLFLALVQRIWPRKCSTLGLDFLLEELDPELELDFCDILRIFKKSELAGVKSGFVIISAATWRKPLFLA